MNVKKVIFSSALVVSFAIALAGDPAVVFAAPPDGKGKPEKVQSHKSGNGGGVHHGSHDGGWDVDIIFGGRDRDIIRDYYRDHGRSCPPGLAKKRNGCLPPGQAKKRYRIGQRLPGDFPIYDIPDILRGRLSGLPDGYGYRQVDGDIAIIDLTTRLVVDAVE
ncbi:MAG: hypothetical protein KAG97_13715 [Victivallales bacterium]|nr:hypothetical protein [Victivallales bacterium]